MTNEEKIISYPNSLETRVALVEMSIVNITHSLLRIENKIDSEFRDLKIEIKEIRKDVKNDTRWLLTIIAALGAIMAHGFHWF